VKQQLGMIKTQFFPNNYTEKYIKTQLGMIKKQFLSKLKKKNKGDKNGTLTVKS
jgi:hypothetical protein